jgi:hypothetical protein
MGVSSMTEAGRRETSLMNFYSAERRAGACPLVANERMAEFAKRLDQIAKDEAYERDLDVIRACIGRVA